MSLSDVLSAIGPGHATGEYSAARVYRGHYCIDPKEDRWIVHDFKVLSGEAEIVPAGPIRVRSFGKPPEYRELQAYDIRPLSSRVRLSLEGPYRDGPRRVYLVRETGTPGMKEYVQRIAATVAEES